MPESETFEVTSYVAICTLCALDFEVKEIVAKPSRNGKSQYLSYYFVKTEESWQAFQDYLYNRVLHVEIHDMRSAMEDFREQRRRLIEHVSDS